MLMRTKNHEYYTCWKVSSHFSRTLFSYEKKLKNYAKERPFIVVLIFSKFLQLKSEQVEHKFTNASCRKDRNLIPNEKVLTFN